MINKISDNLFENMTGEENYPYSPDSTTKGESLMVLSDINNNRLLLVSSNINNHHSIIGIIQHQ